MGDQATVAEVGFAFVFSGSSWKTVRNHPGIAFILPRIPQVQLGCFGVSER